jgi:predicted component of type VI protein secretion system
MLRNLEAKIAGAVEGAFGRAFKSRVQPVELARKLAKEMSDNKAVSVSHTYVPNEYAVYLSPDDREQFTSYESALRKELSDYLLEHARKEGLALVTRPRVALETDERLRTGEFGIQAWLSAEAVGQAERDGDPSEGAAAVAAAADYGHTMVYSPDREPRKIEAPAPTPHAERAMLVGDGGRTVLSGDSLVIGRSRECDLVLDDPNVSRKHMELRRDRAGWTAVDLGSTNGVKVNGRRVGEAPLEPGDEIAVGVSRLTFEVE